MIATYINKLLHNMNRATLVCVFKRANLRFGSVKYVALMLGFSQTPYVSNIKFCMIVLHIELYLFVTLSVTLTLFHFKPRLQQCQTDLTEMFMFLADSVETL